MDTTVRFHGSTVLRFFLPFFSGLLCPPPPGDSVWEGIGPVNRGGDWVGSDRNMALLFGGDGRYVFGHLYFFSLSFLCIA